MTSIIDQIESQLERLKVFQTNDPLSGLMVAELDPDEEEDNRPDLMADDVVRVFDDYVSGHYNAECLLKTLKKLKPKDVSLESESDKNIWQYIADCKV